MYRVQTGKDQEINANSNTKRGTKNIRKKGWGVSEKNIRC